MSNNKKKLKCYICSKKLLISTFKCRCNIYYCNLHKYPEDHNCNYDYKTEYQKELIKNNKKLKIEKIIII